MINIVNVLCIISTFYLQKLIALDVYYYGIINNVYIILLRYVLAPCGYQFTLLASSLPPRRRGDTFS